jgi:hypothetical protein
MRCLFKIGSVRLQQHFGNDFNLRASDRTGPLHGVGYLGGCSAGGGQGRGACQANGVEVLKNPLGLTGIGGFQETADTAAASRTGPAMP